MRIQRHTAGWFFAGALLFFSFLKLPATQIMDTPPQSWEAVLAYAVPHHFLWGSDIVYTYGPFAFLSLDYYWGFNFVPILLWSLVFSAVLTFVVLRLLRSLSLPVRIAFCVLLPLLTVPRDADLGTDPMYLFAIMLYGLACLPAERPGIGKLFILGAMLGLLALFKFTFCVFSLFTLLIVVVAYLGCRQFRAAAIVAGSAALAFLAAWLLLGQQLGNILPWFHYSWQIASGYAAALAFPPAASTLIFGLGVWAGSAVLIFLSVRSAASVFLEIPKIVLLAAGLFLAWKESFVQAEQFHVVVFFLFSILLVFTLPAFFATRTKRPLLYVSCVTLLLAFAPFFAAAPRFLPAIGDGAVRRFADTVTALVAPIHYKHRLEANVASRHDAMALPAIAAIVGDSPVGVLNFDQDVAVLNGFNYVPHPVVQSYSAHTPGLQKLNADFFASDKAPAFLLWRYGTVGNRFPTLDDGEGLLSILNSYVPVTGEGEFVLWKRKDAPDAAFHFVPATNGTVALDEWIPIPAQATWLKIDLQRAVFDKLRGFLYQPSIPAIEVRLEDGSTKTFYLIPEMARTGFIVNPLLATAPALADAVLKRSYPSKVVAVRVFARPGCFNNTVHYTTQIIEGVPALDPP